MRKLTMYYFLLLVFLNVFFALCLPPAVASCEAFVNSHFGSGIKWVCPYPWWPWVGAAVGAVGATLSQRDRVKDNVLRHLLVITLFVELGAMVFTALAFIMVSF